MSMTLGRVGGLSGVRSVTGRGFGDAGGAGATTGLYDFYGSGGFAYRASQSGTAIIFTILQAPPGNTLGKVITQSSNYAAWAAIKGEYDRATKRAVGSIPTGYTITGSGGTTSSSSSSSGKPPSSSSYASRGNNAAASKPPGSGGSSTTDQPAWLSTVTQLFDAATPLATGIIGAVQGGGVAGGSVGDMAAQIARKQKALAKTSNPVERARLEAEIAQLQQAQSMYGSTVSSALSAGGVDYGAGGGGPAAPAVSTMPDWLLPVGAIVLVGGAVLWMATRSGESSDDAE